MGKGFASSTIRHKISQTEQRKRREMFGWQPAGERSESPRPPAQVSVGKPVLLLPATCPRRNHKPVATPAVIPLPAFTIGAWVECDHHIQMVEKVRYAYGMIYLNDNPRPRMAWEISQLVPDDTVCQTCFGDGSMGHTKVDSYTHLNNLGCPQCGGTRVRN